jgi:ubiquitin carboxyl-terminal hydrolase L5
VSKACLVRKSGWCLTINFFILANAVQTTSNACATVALLNIVMNVPDINLGDALKTFKESTRLLKPPYRGQALSHNDFIRNIHNSFLRSVNPERV